MLFQETIIESQASVTSYVVASNPEVLAKLMQDANKRQNYNKNASNSDSEKIPNPSTYTIPASSLNTITVDFATSKSNPSSNQMSQPLKQKLTSASKGMENKQTCTELTSHSSNQSAFISKVNQAIPEKYEKMVATQNSNSNFQKANLRNSSQDNSSKNIPPAIVRNINFDQERIGYQKDLELDKKATKDPRSKFFSSFMSSFNTSCSTHQNSDKVNQQFCKRS